MQAAQGLAWVNGFPIGWYWPVKGPQNTLFVPGPLLHPGENEIIVLEVLHDLGDGLTGADAGVCAAHVCEMLLGTDLMSGAVELTDRPDFYGPGRRQQTSPTPEDQAVSEVTM